jgi:prolyl oligopeptidase
MSSYATSNPQWTTVLDVDELSKKEGISWVWRGSRILPRARDPMSQGGKRMTRALVTLSKSGSENCVIREFDLLASEFVKENPFSIQEPTKIRASYKSRDVLFVGYDSGPNSLTKAGFPRMIREWVRGTDIKNAPVVFEGESTDVAVSSYIDDQRGRGGGIYEVRTRALTSTRSKVLARRIKYEHLLKDDDPEKMVAGDPPSFTELQLPDDSEIDFVGNVLLINLGSDWSPEDGKIFTAGSLLYVNSHKFMKYGPKDRLYHVIFEPTERTCCEDYIMTKEFLVMSIRDNMKSKLEFYKLEKDGNKLRLVGMDKKPQIRSVNIRAVDSQESDEFWLTTSGYIEPSTLWLADAAKMDSLDKKVIRKTGSEGYIVRKLQELSAHFKSSNLEVCQKFVVSKDGTQVPYFMVSRKGLLMNKNNPTLLYGYGGMGVSLGPQYAAPTGIAWIERGGVYVEAIVRGGGEFGASWYEDGRRGKKTNACQDFIAVAEDLISSKVCSPKSLAIRGGVCGGFLVANAYLSRPDLFTAVHCASPILDLRRLKGDSEAMVHEFGDPDSGDWEGFMEKLSPFHNIDDSVRKYPHVLFTAVTHDHNINPVHARKMIKKLWDRGIEKKWPAYYFEITGTSEAEDYAFITTLAYDFMFKKLTKSKE